MTRCRVLICSQCRRHSSDQEVNSSGSLLAGNAEVVLELHGLSKDVEVSLVDCLGVCIAPVAIAIQGEDRASYVFSDVKHDEDVEDLVATCIAYLDAPDGWIENPMNCGRLRTKLVARLPRFPTSNIKEI